MGNREHKKQQNNEFNKFSGSLDYCISVTWCWEPLPIKTKASREMNEHWITTITNQLMNRTVHTAWTKQKNENKYRKETTTYQRNQWEESLSKRTEKNECFFRFFLHETHRLAFFLLFFYCFSLIFFSLQLTRLHNFNLLALFVCSSFYLIFPNFQFSIFYFVLFVRFHFISAH